MKRHNATQPGALQAAKPSRRRLKTIETVQDVKDAASELAAFVRPSHKNQLVAAAEFMHRSKRWKLSTRNAVALVMVLMGRTLPETFLLKCPAANSMCELPIRDQKKYVVRGEPLCVLRLDKQGQLQQHQVSVQNLTKQDCDMLFANKPMVPILAAAIDGAKTEFIFVENAHTGESKLVGVTLPSGVTIPTGEHHRSAKELGNRKA